MTGGLAAAFAAAAFGSTDAIRGLPFTRSYPLEEIGNVPRGSRLTFDAFGRVAVVYAGIYTVLNDTVWLERQDRRADNVSIANVVQWEGHSYYSAGGSWGELHLTPEGKMRPRSLVPPDAPKWVSTTNFTDIVPVDSGVYFGGWSGVAYWDRATGTHRFFEIPRFSKLFRLGEGIYASSFSQPILRIDGRSGRVEPIDGTNFGEAAVDQATSLDDTHELVASRDGRMFVFDGEHLTPWAPQQHNHLTGRISGLARLMDGGVAIAITARGLFLISSAGELFSSLTSSEYLGVTGLATREPGVLWVVGENGVEKVFYGGPLTVFGQRLGLTLSWPIVARWRNKIVVASSGRLFEAIPGDAGAASRFELVKNQPPDGVWAAAASGDRLLVGNVKGVFTITDDGTFAPVAANIDVARLVMTSPDFCFVIGRVEIAALRWNGRGWEECAERIPAPGYALIAHAAKHSAWLELGSNHVARVSMEAGHLRARAFENFPWKDSSWVNVGIVDDTVVLSGAPGDRVFFDETTENFVESPPLRQVLDKLPMWILRVKQDDHGTLWANHEQGVVTLVPSGDGYRIDTTTFDLNNEHFPLVQVLPGSDVWFATAQSLYHVEQHDPPEVNRTLRPMLVSVIDGRTDAELFRAGAPVSGPLRLAWRQNDLSFRFFAGSYAWRRAPIYEFRLADGQNWRTLGTGSLLSFPGLREGSYHLDVRIANAQGPINQPASFQFEILPPWYRTLPAYGLYALTAMLTVLGVVRWSVHQTHRRNLALEKIVRERTDQLKATMEKLNDETRNAATLAERDRLAGEIHDSLQQGLSGLMLQLDATLKLPAISQEVRSRLNVARSMVSFTRHEVQHAIWDQESPLLEGTELDEALRKLAALIGVGTARVDLSVSGSPLPLPSALQHHLLRIAQEAITNAVRHAAPTTIAVRLAFRPDAVALSVTDDGVGFEPDTVLEKNVGHFGLRGLRSRAAKIGGELRIDSTPGRGTKIEVVAPLRDHVAPLNHAATSAA